jgi:hypothetical protein
MPLVAAGLIDGLRDLFADEDGYPADSTEAGQRWAALYHDYAANAIAGPTAPLAPSLTAAKTTLAQTLGSAFAAAKAADAAAAASLPLALDGCYVGFWLLPPVAFAPPVGPPAITGVVSVASPGIGAQLTAAFQNGASAGASAADQAQGIGNALDTWTRTVMVLNTPVTPPGPPTTVPLT